MNTTDKLLRKPDWLKVRFKGGPDYARIERLHRAHGLHSVCRSAACPNQGECWSRGTATFMILGDCCTRDCAFCNVSHGTPKTVDEGEPRKVAEAIAELQLRHAVVTSVTRDDLADGGAALFVDLIRAVRRAAPDCRVEVLIPDLGGDRRALEKILEAGPDILGHNLETVPRLYARVRSQAVYQRSLDVLRNSRKMKPDIPTKSGLMVGMGETRSEIANAMKDLVDAGCRLLTLGQYLQPTRKHFPVQRYVAPEEFADMREEGLEIGFIHVEAGPLVRSSYHAEEQFKEVIHAEGK
ncbi:MAG: lipoyl synthase [Deltaproteobacteria bacterium]|nr:lipoyl synthase [Deltaproteobacteria bacterium]